MLVVVADPPRFVAKSKKGFSTDRKARIELVAKNWSGGAAWLLGLQLVDSFEFSLAQVVLGSSHWHPWGSPEGHNPRYTRVCSQAIRRCL